MLLSYCPLIAGVLAEPFAYTRNVVSVVMLLI